MYNIISTHKHACVHTHNNNYTILKVFMYNQEFKLLV